MKTYLKTLSIMALTGALATAALLIPQKAQAFQNRCGFAKPYVGDTLAQINAAFPGTVLWTFECWGSSMNTQIKGMEDRELLIIATYYRQYNGDLPTLTKYAATYLDAKNLVRWQAAFSQALVTPYVGAYSAPSTAYAYYTHPALTKHIKGGGMPVPVPPPNNQPGLMATIQQIYAEFRMQPGVTAKFAMYQTLNLLATKTVFGRTGTLAFMAGSYFYKGMVYIDPSYGYDLITTYGMNSDSFGVGSFNTQGGQGYYEDLSTGNYIDGYGNTMTKSLTLTSGTNYGLLLFPPFEAAQDIYNFYDNAGTSGGGCLLLGLGC